MDNSSRVNWPYSEPDPTDDDAAQQDKSFFAAAQQIAGTAEGRIVFERFKQLALSRSFEPGMTHDEVLYNEGIRHLALETILAAKLI